MADCVAPGGCLLVIGRLHESSGGNTDPAEGPPWSLSPTELQVLADSGFERTDWDEILDTMDEPPVLRVRLVWRRPGTAERPGGGPVTGGKR